MSPPGRPKGEYRSAQHEGTPVSPPGLPADDPIAAVEAAREQGAAKASPVAFAVIAALARRAAAQQGGARQQMILRIDELLGHQAALTSPVPPAVHEADEPAKRRVVLAGLTELVDRLGRSPGTPVPSASPRPRTNAVSAFKGTWSRLRAEQRLRQVLAHVPAMAGPLNSSHVINRTLQTLRALSPAYLDAFMQHVDTLLWLEQASGAGIATPRTAPPVKRERKPGARAARKP